MVLRERGWASLVISSAPRRRNLAGRGKVPERHLGLASDYSGEATLGDREAVFDQPMHGLV